MNKADSNPDQETKAHSKSNWWIWLYCCIALLMLLFAIAMPFYQNYIAIKTLRHIGGNVNTRPGLTLRSLPSDWQPWVEEKLGEKSDAFKDVVSLSHLTIFSSPSSSFTFAVKPGALETNNWITDADLVHVVGMKKMHTLDLSNTGISDEGIAHLQTLTGMSMLNLSDTTMTDAGMKYLNGMENLYDLNVNGTNITDAGLSNIKRFKQMERIYLSETKVTDVGVKEVAEIPILRTLFLDNTKVTDLGIGYLKKAKHLEVLRLSNTMVTEEGLMQLYELKHLEKLFIEHSRIPKDGFNRLRKAMPDCYINWSPLLNSNKPE